MSASDLIDRLSALHPKGFDLTLDRMVRLLGALGNPERSIPPAFHVAGTNGKGSTCAFLRAILEAAGNTVHVHTSPHLVDWRERYRMGAPGGGRLVGDAALEDALARAAAANAGAHVTVFELLTAAMFILFSETPADYCVIEVGLGGRFDATNVIARPLMSVIAPVSLDHTEHLGDTVEKIAFEKAGIVKPGCPVTIGPQTPGARETLRSIAASRNSPAWFEGEQFGVHPQAGRMVYQDETGLLDLPPPRLAGPHQYANAATAIAAVRHAGIGVGELAFEVAMRRVAWPGRLEPLKPGALRNLAPTGGEVWIDGGHNPDGARALALAVAELESRSPMPLVLVAGMLSTKDSRAYFQAFEGLARHVFTVPVAMSEASRSAAELADIARLAGLGATPAKSVAAALQAAFAAGPVRALICGSLYLVGEVLAKNGTPPD
jgi:dihydrofolate synthase/folylpolyglutamate synthase